MKKFNFQYTTIRNLTPKGLETLIYRGICIGPNLLGIPTDQNVRDAIQTSTKLRREMRDSIANDPTQFVVKNGGITVIAKSIEIDDARRTATLVRPSIINGAQTQACIEWWSEHHGDSENKPLVQFEILILSDEELDRDVSVARNSTHKVSVTSILGYQGAFEELVADVDDKFALRETDEGEDPLKLLQIAELLDDSWNKPWSTYCSKQGVLSRYVNATSERKSRLHALAPVGWALYKRFVRHPSFHNCGLHAKAGGVTRDGEGNFESASDAILFPIIYAYRERLQMTKIRNLTGEQEAKLIVNATTYFTNNARSDVSTMGRKRGAYDDLRGRLEWLAG